MKVLMGWHGRTGPEPGALAGAMHLTTYDASYLWLSRRLGLPLVTLDGALAEAADAL